MHPLDTRRMGQNRQPARMDVALHEAAHAVAAVICGMQVYRLTLAPDPRAPIGGTTWAGYPTEAWPVRTRWAAQATHTAAPFAYALLHPRRYHCTPRQAWAASWGDRQQSNAAGWLIGTLTALWLFRRRAARAAVWDVAIAVWGSPRHVIGGNLVEAVCTRHGLFPGRYVDRQAGVLWPRIAVRPRHLRPNRRTR